MANSFVADWIKSGRPLESIDNPAPTYAEGSCVSVVSILFKMKGTYEQGIRALARAIHGPGREHRLPLLQELEVVTFRQKCHRPSPEARRQESANWDEHMKKRRAYNEQLLQAAASKRREAGIAPRGTADCTGGRKRNRELPLQRRGS
jgi:hypothetical protein